VKRKSFIFIIIFFFLVDLYIHPVSKTAQIACLEQINADIGKLGSGNIAQKDQIISSLNGIKNAFNVCKIKNTGGSAILNLLESYIIEASNFRDSTNKNRAIQFSKDLKKKFNDLVREIKVSLDDINRKDKNAYLRAIIDDEIIPLGSLWNRQEVSYKLESIRDKLDDFRNLDESTKKETLTLLTGFIESVNRDFKTDQTENKRKSNEFSLQLQEKINKLSELTSPGVRDKLKEQNGIESQQDTRTPQHEIYLLDSDIIVLLIVLLTALFILNAIVILWIVFNIFKKRKKENQDAKAAKLLTEELDIAKIDEKKENQQKEYLAEIKSGVIDEIGKVINTEILGIKAEVEIVKRKIEALDFKTSIDDLKKEVKLSRNFVDEKKNDILNVFKTRFDYMDNQNKSVIEKMKEIYDKLYKMYLKTLRLIKESEIEKEELKRKETVDDATGETEQEKDEAKAVETTDEMKIEKTEVKEQKEKETETTGSDFLKEKPEDSKIIKEKKEKINDLPLYHSRREEKTIGFEHEDKKQIPKIQFARDWKKQITEGFEKNEDKIRLFTDRIEKGDNILDWILEIVKKSESIISNDKEGFFRDHVYPGLDAFASKIAKSEFKELKDVFLNILFDALDIEEFGRENEPYAPYMHHLIDDRGGTSGMVHEVFWPGYKLKSTGKIIIKAMVGL
jgi:hypothetical protein